MSEQAMRFGLGLFVLGALALLAVLITLFGGLADPFRKVHHYTVTFDNAPGVAAGTPVRLCGVRIGQVKDVELDNETGKVRVHIVVESRYTIRRHPEARLVHGLLGGDTAIDLVQRPAPAARPVPAVDGETFEGISPTSPGALMTRAAGLMPPARDALQDVDKLVRSLDRLTPLMEKTVREYRDLARATRRMVPEWTAVARATRDLVPEWTGVAKSMRAMVPELQELAKQSRRTVPELRRTGEEIQAAASNWGRLGERFNLLLQTNEDRLKSSLDNLNRALGGVTAVFTVENQRNLAATLRNVRAGSDGLASLTRETGALMREGRQTIRRVSDSVGRADRVLVSMEQAVQPMPERSRSIMQNLDQSADKLNRLLGELRDLVHCAARADGVVRRMLTDPSLYNHLNEAACMWTKILPRLEPILRDLGVFADKIARHPETLGVRGAIVPSAGLKESPSPPLSGRGIDH